jgi:(1->4)-alpha-D-glucan 1-alpha-D-glucosylmutase
MTSNAPLSTYRFQFNQHFTFLQATGLVDYLSMLGIGALYSSPLLTARSGSAHGYDVIDHSRINPEIGTEDELRALLRALKDQGMGAVMDVVPNHMNISDPANRWWADVLENGPSSAYARFFDVDWNPPTSTLSNRVLLPILGEQFGKVLEDQQIQVTYSRGAFVAKYYETTLPIATRASSHILNIALQELKSAIDESHPDVLELESIITAIQNLPSRTEINFTKLRERRREKVVIRRRLRMLIGESNQARHALFEALQKVNGERSDPRSFDLLERILDEQAYRLTYWRVAADEINYRRFFDINELAAIRIEERPVFTAVHEVILRLVKQGLVTGLRIDHVDGLLDPEKYLEDLQRACNSATRQADSTGTVIVNGAGMPFYIIVEKILSRDEQLPGAWPVQGTTGYEFMNLLNGVFVEGRNSKAFHQLYSDFSGQSARFRDVVYVSKKVVLEAAMSSELHVLARRLDRISDQHRWSRDFTLNALQSALIEVIASFPVYRTYIRARTREVDDSDRRHIRAAIRTARRRNPAVSRTVFEFIESVLLLEDPPGLTAGQRAERRDFVQRFQQLTSPVMAKGWEDTAFYRYFPLASLNEVGGDPADFGVSTADFHRQMSQRLERWPHSLSATATHDTKRSEDVRARLNVLSEFPDEWAAALHRWRDLNEGAKKVVEGEAAPDGNEEYLLYQTLIGAWPLAQMNDYEYAVFVERIQSYMNKALKEAKVHTSWINPDEQYDAAIRDFVGDILDREKGSSFLRDFLEFQEFVERAGVVNSLAQVVAKVTLPGVPDFYQGTELWDFSLVDPDNRRAVNYDFRRQMLASVTELAESDNRAAIAEFLATLPDGRLKLFITQRSLATRRNHEELFRLGGYIPLKAIGNLHENILAFARTHGERVIVVVLPRLSARLISRSGEKLFPAEVWGDTTVEVIPASHPRIFRDVFTGRRFELNENETELRISSLFSELPLAVLESLGVSADSNEQGHIE